MNIHHLELFYYVAKFGGIMEAVRKMPYGIQQPAVSGQIIQLEENLGVKLFQRRPFALSPAGERLFESIRPFFSNIDEVCDQIREGTTELLRLGAPTTVLDRYFPEFIRDLHKSCPSVKLTLREGHHHYLQNLLTEGEIDLAITPIEETLIPSFEKAHLLDVNICLLLPASSTIRSADHFWKQDRISETLISLPQNELIAKRFQLFLEKQELSWPSLIELSSLDLIEKYVASGIGVGLGIQGISSERKKQVRRLPLDEIPPIPVGALWKKNLSRSGKEVLDLCKKKASDLRAHQSDE